MAAFFKVPASAGVVFRAEHLFAACRGPAGAVRLAALWSRDAKGRLVCTWGHEG